MNCVTVQVGVSRGRKGEKGENLLYQVSCCLNKSELASKLAYDGEILDDSSSN